MKKKNNDREESFENEGVLRIDLPNSNLVLVLGILSIVSCFCFGIIGIILGIIAIKLYKNPAELYNLAPELYTKVSFKNLKAGYSTAIIGIIISIIFLAFILIFVLFFGGLANIYSLIPF